MFSLCWTLTVSPTELNTSLCFWAAASQEVAVREFLQTATTSFQFLADGCFLNNLNGDLLQLLYSVQLRFKLKDSMGQTDHWWKKIMLLEWFGKCVNTILCVGIFSNSEIHVDYSCNPSGACRVISQAYMWRLLDSQNLQYCCKAEQSFRESAEIQRAPRQRDTEEHRLRVNWQETSVFTRNWDWVIFHSYSFNMQLYVIHRIESLD